MTGGPGPGPIPRASAGPSLRPARCSLRDAPRGPGRRPQILIAASAAVLGLAMIGLKVFVLTHLH